MQELKKVLIITYYWPPSAGSGVQRWLKFSKYLPDYGWEPVIFTPENPDFELKDTSLFKEVPRNLEVLKFPIWEPYGIFRKLKGGSIKDPSKILEKGDKGIVDRISIWMRANLLIPDPRMFWVKPSVSYLTDILGKNKIDTVITTGPPHSLHLIGRNLKRATGVKWVADFRDPWSSWEFLDTLPMTPFVRKKHEELERSVLEEADRVITISPTFQEEIKAIFPRGIDLITNGFDQTDLPRGFTTAPAISKGLKIVYTGIIDAIRDPLPFLKALRAAFDGSAIPVELTLVGKVSDKVVHFVESDDWLATHVHLAGYVSHEEVFEYYEKANLLLLILTKTKNAKGNIPGKIFEYMATGRPVIAIGDPNGDSAQILEAAKAGMVFSHEEVKDIESFLIKFAQGDIDIQAGGEVKKYDRKELTHQLAGLLDEL
ncbi:glycosyltransferase family 4 protein [Litoribacter populi]|uniref:glycosyltransferase family 4 protein n=1 Tax=Litoribacter populi TaxID=2598460 RepID=UPI00117F68B9|nr:glycosyltransferase family 4 protein [Litoribacter populi]